MDNISPGTRCCIVAVDVDGNPKSSCLGGGNGIFANIDPALFIIRIVVLDPNPDDDEEEEYPIPPPPLPPLLLSGMVTAAIGPPLGHPATNVVVVVDNSRATSEISPLPAKF